MQNLNFLLSLPKSMYAIHGSFGITLDNPDFRSGKLRSEYEDIDICIVSGYENALIYLAKTFEIEGKVDFDGVEIDHGPYDAPDFQITMIKFPDGSKVDFHDMENIMSLQKSKDGFYVKPMIDIANGKLKAIKEGSPKSEIYGSDLIWMLKNSLINIQ